MPKTILEHVNITVNDPRKTAIMLERLFGWMIRWEGPSINGGHTVHVGNDEQYLAVYSHGDGQRDTSSSYNLLGGLNHVGIVVDDLIAVERRVKEAGFKPHNHGDYEPGQRFYFHDHDGIEFEVVTYSMSENEARTWQK